MKKLIIGFAFACFVAFGTLSIQSVVAATDNIEFAKLNSDDDPDKNKKTEATAQADGKDNKETKASKDGKASCKPGESNCKDASAKCPTKSKCCASKSTAPECKDKDGDKK
ncbi:MAG: hypothetical protein HQ565_03415 [Bacteroidetes bacterium]|nr:hypothetical protein [Bacteroidota bacterium]